MIKSKMILYIFIVFFTFSFCFDTVNADYWYTSEFVNPQEKKLQTKCDINDGCLPLCIYSDEDGNEIFSIGYFFNNSDSNWIFSYYSTKTIPVTLFYNDGFIIPKSGIYWANEEEWFNSSGYSSLNDNFKCPHYLYAGVLGKNVMGAYSTSVPGKLCFDDTTGNCEKIDLIGLDDFLGFSFEDFEKKEMTYNFVDNYYLTIMRDVIAKLQVNDNDVPDYSLLAEYDKNFSYDSNLTKQNCEYLSKKMSNIDSYLSILVARENIDKFINDRIDSLFDYEVSLYDVRFSSMYKYDNLYNIMNLENGNFRSVGGTGARFSELYNVFPERINFILFKASQACQQSYGVNIKYDKDFALKILKEKYNKLDENNSKIDLDSEYDCGFLNGISDIIATGYFIIELVAVAILIVFSILDYAKVILDGDQDQMKKTNDRFIRRIIILVVLFILPGILNLVLKIFKIQGFNTENPLCVEIKK